MENLKEIKINGSNVKVFESMSPIVLKTKAPTPVAVYDLNGKFLYGCESVEQAAEKTKISSVSIKRAINPKFEKVHVRKFQFASIMDKLTE